MSRKDCGDPQCKQVHHLLDSLLEYFKTDVSPGMVSVEKALLVMDFIKQAERERDTLAAKVLELEAKCAGLRDHVVALLRVLPHEFEGIVRATAAINAREFLDSSDCGGSWKSPKEYAALEAKCAEMRDALIQFQCEMCNGTHLFTFECEACLSGIGECTCKAQKPEPCPQCSSDNGLHNIYAKLERALSLDCGRDYVPRSQLDEAKSERNVFRNALNDAVCLVVEHHAILTDKDEFGFCKTCTGTEGKKLWESIDKALAKAKEALK